MTVEEVELALARIDARLGPMKRQAERGANPHASPGLSETVIPSWRCP